MNPTDISPKVRREINLRDKYCISCGSTYGLQIAHIFIPRSKGGLGIKENLARLCVSCHQKLDNGIFLESEPIRLKVEIYMRKLYPMLEINNLKRSKTCCITFT